MNKQEYLNFMFKFAADTDPLERERNRILQRRNITTVAPAGPVMKQKARHTYSGDAYPTAVYDVDVKNRKPAYPVYEKDSRDELYRNQNLMTYIHGKNPQSKYNWKIKLLNWRDKPRAQAAATAVFPGWKNESSIYPQGVPITPQIHKQRNISQARQLAERIAKGNATVANILQPYFQTRGNQNYNYSMHVGFKKLQKDPKTGVLHRPTNNLITGGQTEVRFPDAEYDDKGNVIKAPPGLSAEQVRQAEALGSQMGTNRRYSPFLSWLYR